jgi:hypothetical protein
MKTLDARLHGARGMPRRSRALDSTAAAAIRSAPLARQVPAPSRASARRAECGADEPRSGRLRRGGLARHHFTPQDVARVEEGFRRRPRLQRDAPTRQAPAALDLDARAGSGIPRSGPAPAPDGDRDSGTVHR